MLRAVRRLRLEILMIHRTLVAIVCGLLAYSSLASAQYRPGTPDGLVTPDWKLQQHPQLEFAASATEAERKQAIADRNRQKNFKTANPDDCNLQCPSE
jgi:hypothetical protein